jgi:serine-type D-Ala-D-Ala carboxypeptidase/endopeptidase (penicillin-binding protein 4)
MKIHIYFLLVALLGSACSPRGIIVKEVKRTEQDLQDHTGFALYDLSSKKFLVDYQSDKYFTPASNTKIFTFYTSLMLLGDSATAFKYSQHSDSLIIWGMGDPSFLYPNTFNNDRVYSFLHNTESELYYSSSNFKTEVLGTGWAWDDYPYSYSAERTAFPMYGNLVSIGKDSVGFTITPRYFMEHFTEAIEQHAFEEILRDFDSNQLTYFPGKSSDSEWLVPFHYSSDMVIDLLSDTLKRQVQEISLPLPLDARSFKSIPLDSLYRVMMQDSDNFIAEQLLLQCAGILSDTLKPEIAIRYAKQNFLSDLPDEPAWVDGSGLSRYNLFTPRTIVKLWEKIYQQVPQERLFSLLAVGGRKGTIRNWYKNEPPFIYGKTGTLSNNNSLSGYLITRKGKVLIFSMMNNNYLASTNEVRKHIEKILFTIREKY